MNKAGVKTPLVIGDVFAADKDVTKAWLTGQDADKASVQAIINGTQGMTVFKDPRTRVQAAVAAAAAFMTRACCWEGRSNVAAMACPAKSKAERMRERRGRMAG